jgi:hypothetical protein
MDINLLKFKMQLTGEGMYDPVDLLQSLLDKEGITNFTYDREHNQYGLLE